MDSNSWISCPSLFSSSSSPSRHYQTQTDLEGEEILKSEFICPFCTLEFDIVGMCCHIDEQQPLEAKNGAAKEKTTESRWIQFSLSYTEKDLKESNLQSLLGESSSFSSLSNIDSDPLLSFFLFTSSPSPNFTTQSVLILTQEDSVAKISPKDTLNCDVRELLLSREDQEKVKKREFVQGLMLSTILDDNH